MKIIINGIKGKDFVIDEKDSLCKKLAMLIEGHCTIGVQASIQKVWVYRTKVLPAVKKIPGERIHSAYLTRNQVRTNNLSGPGIH